MKIHSNLMVTLVGPSGGPRKTTALDMARSLIRDPDDMDIEEWGEKIEIAPEKASGAAITRRMASINNKDHQSITAFLGELGTLLGEQDKEMTDTITNFWDCRTDFEKDTIGRGVETITAPWLNILAATTPTWLADNLASTAIEGGLVSRGLWVYEGEKRGRVPDPPEPPKELRLKLVHDLAQVTRLATTFQLTQEALERYRHWYRFELDKERIFDPRFASHRERKHVNVLKVSMLIALCQRDEPFVDLDDFDLALDYVTDLEGGMVHVFQGVGKNLFSMDYERIKQQVRRLGEVHYRDIIARNIHSVDKPVIDSILITLAEAGEIKRGVGDNRQMFYAA